MPTWLAPLVVTTVSTLAVLLLRDEFGRRK